MATEYRALRRLRIGDDWREPGDAVPEAGAWPNLRAYLDGGWLVAGPEPDTKPDTKADPEPDTKADIATARPGVRRSSR